MSTDGALNVDMNNLRRKMFILMTRTERCRRALSTAPNAKVNNSHWVDNATEGDRLIG